MGPASETCRADMKTNTGAQYEISIDGVPRTYRDPKDLALVSAKFLKSRNPNGVVKLRDLQTDEEVIVAFKAGINLPNALTMRWDGVIVSSYTAIVPGEVQVVQRCIHSGRQ